MKTPSITLSITLTAVFCLTLIPAALSAENLIPETKNEYDVRMKWFDEAKFGLFIHLGVYSTLGGEWKGKSVGGYAEWIQSNAKISPEEYVPLAANFKPDSFDADKWVSDAKKAGVRYIVITTKHHEGFCLWDSKFSEYDTGEATRFDRDILAELSKACKEHGLKFGTYYSITDWHHPSQRSSNPGFQPPMKDKAAYVAYMKAQLNELITKYDTDILWFDGDWVGWWSMDDGIDLYNYLRKLKPTLIINNRVAKRGQFKKDFGTPENSTPGTALGHRWEACWTINHSWGYKISDTNWKGIKQLIQEQVDVNAKGGNLLLNVGSKPDGTWPEACIARLHEMGKWNEAHEEAVYGSHYFQGCMQNWGRIVQANESTEEEGILFAMVFDWPRDNKLKIQGVAFESVKCTTYDGKPLESSIVKGMLVITLPSAPLDKDASVLRLNYKGGLKITPVVDGMELNGDEIILQAKDCRLPKGTFRLERGSHIGYWTDPKDIAEWDINVPAPGRYTVKLSYACTDEDDYIGSDVVFSIDGQKLTGSVKPTGGWTKFKIMEMGALQLGQVGNTKCSVGFGEKKAKALLNLKAVILAPIQ
jgi:alpha-L-fucosidase